MQTEYYLNELAINKTKLLNLLNKKNLTKEDNKKIKELEKELLDLNEDISLYLQIKQLCKIQDNKILFSSFNTDCIFCLNKLDKNLKMLPCEHAFHKECFIKYTHNKCPICRKLF